MKETIAELQARRQKLEQKLAELNGKTDELSRLKVQAAEAEIREIDARVESDSKDTKAAQLEAQETQRKTADADAAVQWMIDHQKLGIRESELQDDWRKRFIADPTLIKAITGEAPAGLVLTAGNGNGNSHTSLALGGRISQSAVALDNGARERTGGDRAYSLSGGFSVKGALRQYYQIVAANANERIGDMRMRGEVYRKKGELALQAAQLFKSDLEPEINKWQYMTARDMGDAIGLKAADYTDPNNQLGTLSGTLVLQRVLPFFAYKYPELLNLYTDFGDTPGLLNQTEMTRIVVQPAVQKYDAALDAAGRPKGWDVVSAAQTTDVPLTLTDYIACPIVFGNSMLASTMRRLFDEQSVLAIKAIAGYFTNMLTNLATKANYPYYAIANGGTVPDAFPTYVPVGGLQGFSMADLDLISAAMDSAKVPAEDRGIMLAPKWYAKLRGDPRLEFMYAASNKSVAGASDFTTEFKLPKLSGFAPYNSPYLPSSTPSVNPTTVNVIGFAFQKAGAILKSRLPQDFTQALGVMIPGSVTTVTDPDTGISLMLVQYVNLTSGYAEWRPEVMLGAAVGDNRAGLVLTSA